ncbi:hypothetical protein P153DRAFT_374595 [Dothidotthia symphoricarpi CBS 119687]|uniref:Uncharacterized protein n=1 Tax=Dothidotthia symphoricarpi CBS 119687 TaxID=1392245 RepID=A0A6A6AHY8_9PLEO|nr:uncharacterized protein P153DRAFT_374595 [Dothidotthia symphoricarpi CBS 119687]KAF2130708.1 hypothetical protein P153DRAFT_374595 [Dothidotthia symphoricarpi CBS 119687]
MAGHIKSSDGGHQGVDAKESQQGITHSKSSSLASNNSGDTLHNSSNGDHDAPYSSPPSVNDLAFENLAIDNGNSPVFKGGMGRYDNPYQRGSKTHNDTSQYSQAPHHPVRNNRNYPSGPTYNARTRGGGGVAGFRNSHTWVSPEAQAHTDFMVIRNSMRRLFKSADVSKWKLSDYIAHLEAMAIAEAHRLSARVKSKEEAHLLHLSISLDVQHTLRKCGLADANFDQRGNYGRILGEQTIWCLDWTSGKDEIAPWPTECEMKWEGDDRAKTGVGRFLPLPREEGPPGIPWNQLPVVEQYPIDMIARIPTMEDVYLPVDEIDNDVTFDLVNRGLVDAIDGCLEL